MVRGDSEEGRESVSEEVRAAAARGGGVLLRLLHWPVLTLGPGRRIGIWFQGCSIGCDGCLAPENRPFDSTRKVPLDVVEQSLRDLLDREEVDGVTISGGEPFDQPEALGAIVGMLRGLGVDDVLVYSGYGKEHLLREHPETIGALAALVDGPFVRGAFTDAVWKGSANQTLTVFNPKFDERYALWSTGTKGRLQTVRYMDEVHLVGIPRQQDVPSLVSKVRNALRRNGKR